MASTRGAIATDSIDNVGWGVRGGGVCYRERVSRIESTRHRHVCMSAIWDIARGRLCQACASILFMWVGYLRGDTALQYCNMYT